MLVHSFVTVLDTIHRDAFNDVYQYCIAHYLKIMEALALEVLVEVLALAVVEAVVEAVELVQQLVERTPSLVVIGMV